MYVVYQQCQRFFEHKVADIRWGSLNRWYEYIYRWGGSGWWRWESGCFFAGRYEWILDWAIWWTTWRGCYPLCHRVCCLPCQSLDSINWLAYYTKRQSCDHFPSITHLHLPSGRYHLQYPPGTIIFLKNFSIYCYIKIKLHPEHVFRLKLDLHQYYLMHCYALIVQVEE